MRKGSLKKREHTHEKSQRNTLSDEPKQHDQSRHAQYQHPGPTRPIDPMSTYAAIRTLTSQNTENTRNSQPVPPRPPQREQKKHRQDEAGNFAGVCVEPTRYQHRADERGAEVACR